MDLRAIGHHGMRRRGRLRFTPPFRPGFAAALVAAGLATAAGAALAFDQHTESRTYLVQGTSAEAIRAGLDRLGPFDPRTGQRTDSLTTWDLDWRFDTRMAGARCQITRALVNLRIVQTLPRLEKLGELAPDVRRDWERYFAARRQYEDGRTQIAARAAQEIESAVKALERDDCASLQLQADATARGVRDRARAQEIAFEQQTDRGRSLGARFPWTEGEASELTEAEQRKLPDRVARPPAEHSAGSAR